MKSRILIVEDESGWRQLLSGMLGAYEVVEAATVDEARRRIDESVGGERPLNLVILDLGLSKVGGIATGQAVLAHLRERDTRVPCIVITGRELSMGAARRLFRKYNIFDGLGKDDEEDLLRLEEVVQAALASVREPVAAAIEPPPGTSPAPPVAAVRELLLQAFTRDDLVRFCQDRVALQPVVSHISPAHALQEIVDRVIEYCRTHVLWDFLLAEVKQVNARQYELYESRLGRDRPGT